MTIRDRYLPTLATLVLAAWLAGCADPLARSIAREREERINHWLSVAARREAEGARKTEAGVNEIGKIFQRDARKTRENEVELNDIVRREVRRWNERQSKFQARIAEELAGKPETIPHTAIRMFY